MNKKQKRILTRIIVAFVFFAAIMISEKVTGFEAWLLWAFLYAIPYFIVGWDILWKAIRNISKGQVFDENFLMVVASIGAYGTGEFSEAVAVMLFYQVGELFQSYAVNRSRQNIASLMDITPEYANLEVEDGMEQCDPDDVEVGSVIVIKPGERIPLDGVVLTGESMIDTSALTGESMPRSVKPGEEVISGCINGSGLLRVKTSREYEDSTVARILELVENASSRKAKAENFITKFAKYYTPTVVIAAVILGIIPPIILGGGWSDWIVRACTFLVISCPCALVISVPMSFFGGIGAASNNGILVKGGNYLEALRDVGTVVFDKTGTLTKGQFEVSVISPVGCTEHELLEFAAMAESCSDHPIAESVCSAWEGQVDRSRISDAEEVAGHGIKAVIDGKTILAGNLRLIGNSDITPCRSGGTAVYITVDSEYKGYIVVEDAVKPTSKETIKRLKEMGITTVMLTGDRNETASAVAAELELDRFEAELLPQNKVEVIEKLEAEAAAKKKNVAFVGDGINDAPVLARADVGVAMGSMGSDAAIEAADVVLMDDNPLKLLTAINIAKKTVRIVMQNIIFALSVKLIVLVMGALGVATMWEAVFADVGVCVIAVVNSMRALNVKK